MSAVDERHEIVRQTIPKLIKSLTGFEEDEENFKRCEQFAWYTIKNHRNLSVNSHEIKRKIEGMEEKFMVENYKIYGDHLAKLCNGIINHPICLKHYEVDVQWSVIDFLFNLSYNPVGALRKNKDKISLDVVEDIEDDKNPEHEYWTKILKEDFIPLEKSPSLDDSELSDWSETSSEVNSKSEHTEKYSKLSVEKVSKPINIISGVNLEPPKKGSNFSLFDSKNSKQWLFENCQHSWWLNNKSEYSLNSPLENAHFAQLWNHYLTETSNNLIKYEPISTDSEYCLLREIIWMFNSPQNCKFFIVDGDEINIRPNVTIPSVTVNGLKTFLNVSFVPYIKQHNVLRKFINSIYEYGEKSPPKTYECYAASLREILKPFYLRILEVEITIKDQQPVVITTIMQIRKDLNKDFQYLENIYEIHQMVVLDFKKFSPHILTAYLLAGLLRCFRDSSSVELSNLCTTIFLSCVKVFCNIIDTWWTEGRLDDWQNEFLFEKSTKQEIILRPYEKSKEISFFVPTNISKCILDDSFLRILREHSLEAGCTLNLLYQINKIGNLRNAYNFSGNLYETFMEDVLKSILQFKNDLNIQVSENSLIPEDSLNKSIKCLEENEYPVNKFLAECSTMNDEFLLMAFACNLDLNETLKEETINSYDSGIEKDDSDVFLSKSVDILEMLNNTANIILPLEEIILCSITRILRNRISFANNFVINMYRQEFEIAKHLQNIRRVLLFESSDLLHYFYIKIFKEIESGINWANPFALTVQLDDLMSSKYPDVTTLFRVEVNCSFKCQTTKVIEAVNEISIFYNVRNELNNIINDKIIEEYNKVFRFLLKVKWGLWTLENLSFPKSHKKPIPYSSLAIIDLYMRRLEQLRFWMIYSIQCIHFHLMTHVLQSMGQQLDKKINNCLNLNEMKSVHKSYISTVCEHCFLTESSADIQIGVIQLLNLVYVLRMEWRNCTREIENNFVINDNEEMDNDGENTNYILSSQIEEIERTYIMCHQYLAKTLNNEVYLKQNQFLSGLSAAFNTSIPY